MPKGQDSNPTLPFQLIYHGPVRSEFGRTAVISFESKGGYTVYYQNFTFQNGTIELEREETSMIDTTSDFLLQRQIPVFSILAVVLIILFRNLFFSAFERYFLSLRSNYEIDFNIQKIGVVPVLISVAIILLVFSDFSKDLHDFSSPSSFEMLGPLRRGIPFLLNPLALSVGIFFLLNLTTRLFPLIFSDIKTLFGLSLLILVWNFASFGSNIDHYLSLQNFISGMVGIYFTIRTILLFNVLRRAYRFHVPITLFYICVFNLGTILILFNGLHLDIFRLYE